ncbi:MAG: peptidoglycan editing factor PgeF [Gammaproteobacteria bacterium]|nr:peptidoglycan editing factor PgeF [Gammaproteobacteria bacterium]
MNPDIIIPDWPAPRGVRAAITTRQGGYSSAPFNGFNLAGHVGDSEATVTANRVLLKEYLQLPTEPFWLQQVHGIGIVDAATAVDSPEGDGSYSTRAGVVCAVLTADCLPVLLCDRNRTRVAAVHAGWRGLCAGVIESAVRAMQPSGEELLAWLGPAIGPRVFEVGPEVKEAFLAHDSMASTAFTPSSAGRWLADIYELARQRLQEAGVRSIYGGGSCTFTDATRFYSYRRDGVTGRMASLIWLDAGISD